MSKPVSLVFIDETSVSTNMVRLYGRCPCGVRLVEHVPFGQWKTMTFVSALRHDGMVAPMLIQGPMNGELFLTYVKQCLAPTLKPNDIVVAHANSAPGCLRYSSVIMPTMASRETFGGYSSIASKS